MEPAYDQLPWSGERSSAPFWMCLPGQSLIVSVSPLDGIAMEYDLKRQTGLPMDFPLSVVPMCAYPIPDIGEYASDEPVARRIENLDWFGHPVMWLKGEVLRSQKLDEAIGRMEFDSEIALRIALQLEVSCFYQEQPGEWLDVCDFLNINVNDPFDVERIRSWQQGGDDELFDTFDLGQMLMEAYPVEEAAELVQDVLPYGLICSGAASSHVLLELVDRSLDSMDPSALPAQAQGCVNLGWTYADHMMTDSESDEWMALLKEVNRDDGALMSTDDAVRYLRQIRPILEHIVEDNADVVDDAMNTVLEIRSEIMRMQADDGMDETIY